ncbi:transcription termination protein NusA [Sporolactobacillus inulinus]|uniref:Transcription termination protein NusA n=1 Tax=Sporolactobacillus inulinus TaxID=2078 RepID=A0A4Y1Z6F3_9BACL|nr:transcription termination protein NusA [Sporolactobacillus inulinus]
MRWAKGARVQTIVDELKGEKIDIVRWSEDPVIYVANALSPSKVIKVLVHEEEKATTVIVPDYQLSLAIGKRGQNARLAAKLTGWKIDIKSESEAEELGLFDEESASESPETGIEDQAAEESAEIETDKSPDNEQD